MQVFATFVNNKCNFLKFLVQQKLALLISNYHFLSHQAQKMSVNAKPVYYGRRRIGLLYVWNSSVRFGIQVSVRKSG